MGLERVREKMTVPEGRRESVMGEGTRGPCGPREAIEGKLESSPLGMVTTPWQAALFRAGFMSTALVQWWEGMVIVTVRLQLSEQQGWGCHRNPGPRPWLCCLSVV